MSSWRRRIKPCVVREVLSFFPAVQSLGLQSGVAGRLTVSVDQAVLDPSAPASLTARVQVTDGKLPLATLGKPIDNVTFDLTVAPDRIELKHASAIIGGGGVSASGFIDQPAVAPTAPLDDNCTR